LPYAIEHSPDAGENQAGLSVRHQRVIVETIDEQLRFQPNVETRNRKPLRRNPLAPWELRIGRLRVYYDIAEAPEPTVYIRAVGVKRGSRVTIGKEEIQL